MSSITVQEVDDQITKPRYPTGDATQGPYSFGSSGFLASSTSRESGASLRRLLFPELLKSQKARKAARDDACMIDRSWIKAQLQHYGIDFSPNFDPFKAKALLLTSVAHELCNAVPPQILEIESTLKEEYDSRMKEYRDKLKMYDAQELPKRVQKFEACATPTEEAECDARLFLSKYFLGEDGNPDRTKTPNLILLPGYTDRGLALAGNTERVPGLHVADGGLGGGSNVMVIGWDRARVNDQAHQIDMEQTLGRGVLRASQDWERQMISHRTYVKNLHSRTKTVDLESDSSFPADNFTGKYFMGCETIQHDWPVISKKMGLRAFNDGRLAIFDLGVVVGLMVLDKTQEDVTKILEEGRWDADPYDEEVSDPEDEFEDASGDEADSDEADSDNDRASRDNENQDHTLGKKPNTRIDFTSGRPSKYPKIESSHPRRLHFQWRGYNTMTGAIQSDPHNRNTGYLDFANNDATVFEGNIHLNGLGGKMMFQGYKLPGLTGPLTLNWNSLSHLAAERAKGPEYRP